MIIIIINPPIKKPAVKTENISMYFKNLIIYIGSSKTPFEYKCFHQHHNMSDYFVSLFHLHRKL